MLGRFTRSGVPRELWWAPHEAARSLSYRTLPYVGGSLDRDGITFAAPLRPERYVYLDRISQPQWAVVTRCLLALCAWTGLICLLLVAVDGIPDTEQLAGILVAALLLVTGIEPSGDRRSKRTVAVSLSPPSAYLAFLLRSPPAAFSLD